MWTGGVRVAVLNYKGEVLLVKQHHPEREIWLLPGGGIEDGELSASAAVREVKEETGLDIRIIRMLWHIEQLKEGVEQRYVNYFLGEIVGGELNLGMDPEYDGEAQVLREVKFVGEKEMAELENVHPDFLKEELWGIISGEGTEYDPYKVRTK